MSVGYNPKIVTNGLVLCLDAGNIRSYPGSGTTWTDLSGNGLNGTMTNVTYNAGNGGYMSFNGTNSIVDCGTSDSLYSTSFTIEAVIYPITGGGASLGRIVDRSAAGTIGYLLFCDTTGSFGTNVLRYLTFAFTAEIFSINQLSLNTWQHITVTHSGATGVLYKNGTQIATVSTMSNPPTAGTTNFYIGNRAALDRSFNGRISSVKFYNRALSDVEIRQNFNATRGRYGI